MCSGRTANEPVNTEKELYLPELAEKELHYVLTHTLNQLFLATIRIDLQKDKAFVLQSADMPEVTMRNVVWADRLKQYGEFMHTEELEVFSSEHLLELYHCGQRIFSKEFPYYRNSTNEWMTMTAYLTSEEGTPYATVIVRKSSGEHLLNRIVDLYVYSTCDYFIYLDVKKNSYTSFSRSDSGTPLPPAVCSDYSAEIVKYAENFVVPEDRERVIFEMSLERVLKKLETQPTHAFTCGVLDPVRGYTRKRLLYQYYNRETQMILLSRTDITDTYLEEQKNQNELRKAKQMAKTDALTGLYNLQGIVEEITRYLETSKEISALLFIDMDDFKKINDTLGHSTGNEVLRKIAETLRANVRSCDLVGRIGGDEFLVLFCGVKSAENVRQSTARLHEAVCRLSQVFGISTSCSIGIAVFPEDGRDYAALMECADKRVYRAKRSGKNQFAMS